MAMPSSAASTISAASTNFSVVADPRAAADGVSSGGVALNTAAVHVDVARRAGGDLSGVTSGVSVALGGCGSSCYADAATRRGMGVCVSVLTATAEYRRQHESGLRLQSVAL